MLGWLKNRLNRWFPVESPLTPEQRLWIDKWFAWLRNEFGDARLHGPVILPTEEYFPDAYRGTTDDASVLLNRVCTYMDVKRSRLRLECYQSRSADVVAASFDPTLNREYAMGLYDNNGQEIVIWLESTKLDKAQEAISTLSHELGHVHLLGDGRFDQNNPEHEPLTDLLTVYFGLGIFMANTALSETNWKAGQYSGWSMSRSGYLSIAEYSYALAVYAFARGEQSPSWIQHLRPDVQAMMKMELANLANPATTSNSVAKQSANDEQIDTPSTRQQRGSAVSEVETPVDTGSTELDDQEAGLNEGESETDDPFTLGSIYASQGRHDEAVEAFSRVLELDPDDGEAWLNRARSNASLGKHSEAIHDCSRAIEINSADPHAYCDRAEAYLNLNQFSLALSDLENVRKIDPLLDMQYLLSGVAHFNVGDHNLAIADLDLAIQRTPTWYVNYVARSRVHRALGNDRRAEADLAEAIRREPRLSDSIAREADLVEMIRKDVREVS